MFESRPALEEGLKQLGLNFTDHQLELLFQYQALLIKWNAVYNLTASSDPADILYKHILDSLTIVPFIRGPNVLDIGSGAGLPGIPLAILLPDCHFTLLDSNGKKTRFQQQAQVELKLTDNLQPIKSRAEEYRPARPFDTVVSRAFASLQKFAEASIPHSNLQTALLAMKGRRPRAELQALSADFAVESVQTLQIPGLADQRHLVKFKRVS